MTDAFPPITAARARAALAVRAFDGRAAQRIMEPASRGRAPAVSATESPREASALAFLFPGAAGLALPLTLRHDALREHSGQVSLPGGRPEPGEDAWATALREAHEEIGLDPARVQRLGVLAPVYIPVTHTRLLVHVGLGDEAPPLAANPDEVVRLELVPVGALLAPGLRKSAVRRIAGRDVEIPYFDLAGLEVWGATAMALSELAERLRLTA